MISPASDALRAVIVAACETSGDRHVVLAEIGQAYDAEVDFQLRVSLAIDFYKLQRARGDGDAFIDRLRVEGNRRGPDWELHRASAFAGLIVLGRAEIMNESDQPRELFIGSPYRDGVSGPLCAVMVEHWDAMKAAFGADVPARIRSYDGSVWSWLAPYVGRNPSARADFLAWCQETDHIGLQALRSLAELMPSSDLLYAHLNKILTPPLSHDSRLLPLVTTAATLLRDQFAADPLVDLLGEDLAQGRNLVGALALAAAKPADPRLGDITLTAVELARTHGEWGGAVEMSARLETAEQVVAFVQVFADRRPDRSWLPAVPVDALVERVRADSEVRDKLGEALRSPASPDAFVAMARLLSAAAALGGESERLCADRLAVERASADPPTAVLDVMSSEMRPLSHVLTDLIEARSGF